MTKNMKNQSEKSDSSRNCHRDGQGWNNEYSGEDHFEKRGQDKTENRSYNRSEEDRTYDKTYNKNDHASSKYQM